MHGKTTASTLLLLIGVLIASAVYGSPSIVLVESVLYGPEPLDPFRYPEGILADPERGIFLIADTGNSRLIVFDHKWRSRGVIEFRPGPNGVPTAPKRVASDSRGRLFLIDMYRTDIEVVTSRGDHLGFVGSGLSEEIRTGLRPQDIQVDTRGFIYVLYGGDRPGIEILDPRGLSVRRIGFHPVGEGLLVAPTALDVHAEEIAVVDAQAQNVVLVFTFDGALRATFGVHGEGEGTFSIPIHIAWGPEATLWVTDTRRHSITVFDREGHYLGRVGGFGRGPGQFYYPVAVSFLAGNRMLVLERAGARLQVLEINSLDVASTNAGLE